MSLEMSVEELTRDIDEAMEKVRLAGSALIIENDRPIARIIPVEPMTSSEKVDSKAVSIGKEFIDEYADVFAELAK